MSKDAGGKQRQQPIKRGKPPKRSNRKRQAKNHERSYGDKATWIRQQPCHFCGAMKNVEAAHGKTGGMGYKAGSETLIPMCGPNGMREGCHRAQHRMGWPAFLASRGAAGANVERIMGYYVSDWLAVSGAAEENTE